MLASLNPRLAPALALDTETDLLKDPTSHLCKSIELYHRGAARDQA